MRFSVIRISDAYMYYIPILRVNINMHAMCHLRATHVLAWAHVALPRGLECHVAPTWVLHENITPFSTFFNFFNHLKFKNKFEKNPEKSLKLENSYLSKYNSKLIQISFI